MLMHSLKEGYGTSSATTVKRQGYRTFSARTHTLSSVSGAIQGVYGPIVGMPLTTGLLLMLLSTAVVTVSLDRGRWWLQWWRHRWLRRRRWRDLRGHAVATNRQLEDWDRSMRFGEPLLQAAAVLAPLLGLTGTVLGLIRVLSALGPDLTLPAGTSLQGYGQVLISTAFGLVVSLVASASLFANQGLRSWQIGRLERALQRRDRGGAP